MTAQMAATFKAGGIPRAPPLPQATADPAQPPPAGAPPALDPAAPTPATVAGSPTPQVSPTPNANGELIYTAVEGDSVYGIAARFGLTAQDIYRLNNFTVETVIKVGDPVLIGYGSVTVVPIPGAAAASAAPLANVRGDGAIMHVVVAGDTALGISGRYDITLEEFYSLNGFTEETIFRPGDQLVVGYEFVPLSVGGSTDLPVPTAPPSEAPPATAVPLLPTVPVVTAAPQFTTPVAANPGAVAFAQPTKDVAKAVTGAGPTATPTPEDTVETGEVGRMESNAGGANLLLPLAAGLIMLVVGMMGLALYRRQ
jgi:LysM repeat protein